MEIKKVPINRIKLADWNPKYNSEYLKEKLKQSILYENSPGVLAVRELDNGDYEVIDGNHRLIALLELGYKEVWIENLGKISDEKALMVFWQRNEIWFPIKYDVAIPKLIEEDLLELANKTSPKEIRLTPRIEIEKEEDIEISPTHFVAIELDGELAEWVAKKADEDNIPIAEEVLKIVRNKISTD